MKTLGLFVFRFALFFGLLVWPWPGLREAVSNCFIAEARFLVGATFPKQPFQVGTFSDPRFPTMDIQVSIPMAVTDPKNVEFYGRVATMTVPFDSGAQGWLPLAVLIALGIATPLPWSKRIRLLLGGVVFVQLLVAATILVSVAYNFAREASPAESHLLLTLANHLLVENIWFGFVPSFLLWVTWLAGGGYWKHLAEEMTRR